MGKRKEQPPSLGVEPSREGRTIRKKNTTYEAFTKLQELVNSI